MFRHNIACMIISFVFSLDIPVMINILYKIIKILYRENVKRSIFVLVFI